ncbi:hypothetical protein GD1_161 [Paraglaciecola Antarctic GD virus 1]|nr:hypothetical protein GD1_161 [Paraglaciecola Antarctic GD virus 1]
MIVVNIEKNGSTVYQWIWGGLTIGFTNCEWCDGFLALIYEEGAVCGLQQDSKVLKKFIKAVKRSDPALIHEWDLKL